MLAFKLLMQVVTTGMSAPSQRVRTGITGMLLTSAACVYIAPLFMPTGYSWMRHAISESAAQGLAMAWLARLGMLLFGLAVLWLVSLQRGCWVRGVCWMQGAFGVLMLAAATFSHRPWLQGVAIDEIEDILHSIAASVMGFAFAFGVLFRFMQRDRSDRAGKIIDLIALFAATALTPVGMACPSLAGLLQRIMFAIGYCWFGYEALVHRASARSSYNSTPT